MGKQEVEPQRAQSTQSRGFESLLPWLEIVFRLVFVCSAAIDNTLFFVPFVVSILSKRERFHGEFKT